jgi:hypothetical protein
MDPRTWSPMGGLRPEQLGDLHNAADWLPLPSPTGARLVAHSLCRPSPLPHILVAAAAMPEVASLLFVLQFWRQCLEGFDGMAVLHLRPIHGGECLFCLCVLVSAAGDPVAIV